MEYAAIANSIHHQDWSTDMKPFPLFLLMVLIADWLVRHQVPWWASIAVLSVCFLTLFRDASPLIQLEQAA